MTILNIAIAKGDLQTVRTLIELKGYSPNYIGLTGLNDTPLTVAAQFGQRKVMDYLIQKGADINAKGYYFNYGLTPMEAALQFGHTQVVANLLANNAELPYGLHKTDVANQYLLKAASTNDTWSIEKILGNTEANINTHDNFMKLTPLHNAVMNDCFDATHKLILHGAKVNAIDIHGWTPLHYAASNSDTQFAKFLIEKGAKINAEDNSHRTPLFSAVLSNEEDLIYLLVKHGAKVNHTDMDGRSALDLAIINDAPEMIKCLVLNGAKISANINQSTPLEQAAESGKLQAVEMLIELGSSLSHKNAQGKTALELAFKAGEIAAVNLLKLHGAEVPLYIQEKLNALEPINIDQVLVETTDNLASVSGSISGSNAYHAQPIGPILGTDVVALQEHAFGA